MQHLRFLAMPAVLIASACLSACGGGDELTADMNVTLIPVVGTYDLSSVGGEPLPVPWMPLFLGSITAGLIQLDDSLGFRMEFTISNSPNNIFGGLYARTSSSTNAATIEFTTPCGIFTISGCQDEKFLGQLVGDTLTVQWASRAFRYMRRA